MIKAVLKDGWGTGKKLRISGEGYLHSVVHPHPPKSESDTLLPLREYLTLDNDGSTIDMRVDGATSEKIFSINASHHSIDPAKRDRYIARLSFVIADAGATLNDFGNIGALANGFEVRWVTDTFGSVTIAESLKTNFDFVRFSGGTPMIGDGTGAFRANNVSGTSEAYLPHIDFDEVFGVQWGFRLRHATNDRIEIVVKDDVTGVDQFDCIAYGTKF
jgi:hypothetical protein